MAQDDVEIDWIDEAFLYERTEQESEQEAFDVLMDWSSFLDELHDIMEDWESMYE